MNRMMIDIETLSTRPDAAVLSIGYCIFNNNSVSVPQEFLMDVDEQIRLGRHVDFSTICWWMGQGDEAKDLVFSKNDHRMDIVGAQRAFKWVIEEWNIKEVWSHGFMDLAVLSHMFDDDTPWSFRDQRDTRTLSSLYPGVDRPQPEIPHSAGSDAFAQALWVRDMMASAGGGQS